MCHKTRFGREHLNDIGSNDHPFAGFVQQSVDPWLKINPNKDIVDQGLHLYDSWRWHFRFCQRLLNIKMPM